MDRIFPTILATLTRHNRHRVDNLKWGNLWTYNLFRVWEIVFWRRNGESNQIGDHIRREGAQLSRHYADGREEIVWQRFFTWEALICYYEVEIRLALKSFCLFLKKQFAFRIVPMPALATPFGAKVPIGYSFAIAADTADTATTSGTPAVTRSYTVTGSNPAIYIATMGDVAADNQTGTTYAGTAAGKIDAQVNSGRTCSQWYLSACATGANNMVVSGGSYAEICGISFSGVKDTGTTPDSHGTSTSFGTVSTTVVASNCWLVSYCVSSGGGSNYTMSTGTIHLALSNEASGDSGGTVGTGSQSLVYATGSSTNWHAVILSIEPSPASGPANLKSYNTNVLSNIKSIDTNLIANVKSFDTNV